MRFYYFLGMSVVYLGFLLLLWEVCIEPRLIERPPWVQIAVIALVLGLFDFFSVGVVGAHAPITFQSYAMRKGDYPPDTVIAGIKWDSHLTDLRVSITNPSDEEYENLDIVVQPDYWSHRAALLMSISGCDVSPTDGNTVFFSRAKESGPITVTSTRVGLGFDTHDSAGNVYIPLATETGYRLRCAIVPPHFAIQMVFAVVCVPSDLLGKPADKGEWAVTASVFGAARSEFSVLGPRPNPSMVRLKGSYRRNLKPFEVEDTLPVLDGN